MKRGREPPAHAPASAHAPHSSSSSTSTSSSSSHPHPPSSSSSSSSAVPVVYRASVSARGDDFIAPLRLVLGQQQHSPAPAAPSLIAVHASLALHNDNNNTATSSSSSVAVPCYGQLAFRSNVLGTCGEYAPTAMELNRQRPIPTAIDPIAALALHEYALAMLLEGNKNNNVMDPKDRDLLEFEQQQTKIGQDVPWLKPVDYGEVTETKEKKQFVSQPSSSSSDEKPTAEERDNLVEKTFEESRALNPIHPTNPSAKVVQTLDLLPNFELWGTSYILALLDGDPLQNSVIKASEIETAKEIKRRAFIKPRKNAQGEKVAVMFAPREDSLNTSNVLEGKECEYEWLREYKFESTELGMDQNEDQQFVLIVPGGETKRGIASFVPVARKTNFKKITGKPRSSQTHYRARVIPTQLSEEEIQQRSTELSKI
eukprot:TRINITY_DN2066_c0_g1_i1.p1 TRINITY_DN2066_c0_g1~~TRINITY_DN2066_c0_g1_i1.p1  ORF type:complete len:428 (+),score=128.07 TRINITY_DN2066_c0_g1_i1:3-1286(+)